MLGFQVFISDQHPDTWPRPVNRDFFMASWMIGPFGLSWLDALVKAEKAVKKGSGYPLFYTALAKDVLPLLKAGPPHHDGPLVAGENYFGEGYILPGGPWNVMINRELISACLPDQPIYIHAWDQS